MSSTRDPIDSFSAVESLLPSDWRLAAERFGLCPTRRTPGAVLPPASSVVQVMLHLVAAAMPLRTTAAAFAATGLVSVSHVTIHKWFRKAVAYFSYLLDSLRDDRLAFAASRWAGYTVRAVDATTAQRPGAKGTTARIHYCLRLNDMACAGCLVTDETVGESLGHFPATENVLDIGDRYYSNPRSVAEATRLGGAILVRWNPPGLPLYDAKGRKCSPRSLLRQLRLQEVREWEVEVRPKGQSPIPARLIVTRLPADKAAEARARIRRDHDGPVTAQVLFWAGFVMLVTTVPATRLDCFAIAQLYCLRWQIELQFKRDKSLGGLGLLPNRRPDTIKAWLLAKLVLCEIARRLALGRPARVRRSRRPSRRPKRDRSALVSGRPENLWECTAFAWALLRGAFLLVDWRDLRGLTERFRSRLRHIKAKADPGQVAAFLTFISAPAG